jgi:hypothetical protein
LKIRIIERALPSLDPGPGAACAKPPEKGPTTFKRAATMPALKNERRDRKPGTCGVVNMSFGGGLECDFPWWKI